MYYAYDRCNKYNMYKVGLIIVLIDTYLQVQQGKLKRAELKDCLKMLFPAKGDKDLENLINTLHDHEESVSEDEQDL